MKKYMVAGVGIGIALAMQAQATLIDFEDGTDDGSITPGLYNAQGISIIAQPGTALAYEKVGAQGGTEGFVTDTFNPKSYDDEDASVSGQLGEYFMRHEPGLTIPPQNWPGDKSLPFFTIQYLWAPSGVVGGQIWDIDGTGVNNSEQWRVDVLDANDNVLDFALSAEYTQNDFANSLDSRPWDFSFLASDYLVDIDRLEFYFTGTKTSNIGVAFDNFQSGVSVPDGGATLALMGVALFGLSGLGRRIKK